MDEPYRTIRVFVSSTFRDMQAEREELIKRVFPQLRKLCETRSVTWGEIDLRWGISDEEKAEGKVLPICLSEIERCRPYFIGILGERYGWIQEELPSSVVESETWLSNYQGRSITELEILHGVLNNPAMANHAFFYFRDSKYIDTLPSSEREFHIEAATEQEVALFGHDEAARRAQSRELQLTDLKDRIRQSGFPVRENYSDPEILGQWVLRDFTDLIDRLYPEGVRPDPMDHVASNQKTFTESRTKFYISRETDFQRLDEHVAGNDPPLTVVGETGAGKSALLANWVMRFRNSHPNILLLTHFVEATPESSDWTMMLRRITLALLDVGKSLEGRLDSNFLGITDWAADAKLLRAALERHPKRKAVIVLDGVDKLEDSEAALDLTWLPRSIPDHIRIIMSSAAGRPLRKARRRGWPLFEITSLGPEERERFVHGYLRQFRKTLSASRAKRIAAKNQMGNPTYLQTLLEELRIYGDHLTLDDAIERYLATNTLEELYGKLLDRWERDYELNRPGLVREMASFLWTSREGLSEDELLTLLGSDRQRLPQGYFSPLYLAMEASLLNRNGLLCLGNEPFRTAIEKKFLSTKEEQSIFHNRLADFFQKQELLPRTIHELPWQLFKAESWKRLFDLLSDLNFLQELIWRRPDPRKMGFFSLLSSIMTEKIEIPADLKEAQFYWMHLEANSEYRMSNAYGPVLESPEKYGDLVSALAVLLSSCGYTEKAIALRKSFATDPAKIGDAGAVGYSALEEAFGLLSEGEFAAAMPLLQQAEALFRKSNDELGLARTLGNQAAVLQQAGELQQARELHEEVLRVSLRIQDAEGAATAAANVGSILIQQGDREAALKFYRQAEHTLRTTGNRNKLQMVLEAEGEILVSQKSYDAALALFQEAEQLAVETYQWNAAINRLKYQASILEEKLANAREAANKLEEALRIANAQGWAEESQQIRRRLESVRSRLTFKFTKRR